MLGVFAACATVPYTNRSQFMLVSESQDLALGAQAYSEVLKKEKVVHDPAVVDAAVTEAIAETGATSAKDMGRVMKAAMARLAGQTVDGKAVNELVRKKLSGV